MGILSFRLRLHGLSRLEQICWNMLIEAAHFEKSNLFLQSEPVTERKYVGERKKKRFVHKNAGLVINKLLSEKTLFDLETFMCLIFFR